VRSILPKGNKLKENFYTAPWWNPSV
jgi:hypothetical protein